jgi:hypothetical protein
MPQVSATPLEGSALIVRQPEKIMTGTMVAIRVLSPMPDFRKCRLSCLSKAPRSSDEREAAFASGTNPESLKLQQPRLRKKGLAIHEWPVLA